MSESVSESALSTQGWTDIQSCKTREREREAEEEEEEEVLVGGAGGEQGEEEDERGGARDRKFQESSFFRVRPEPEACAEPNQLEIHLCEWALAPSLVKHCHCIKRALISQNNT